MTVAVEIHVRFDLETDTLTPDIRYALENLADVMGVQAEDGLYYLGSPIVELDDVENAHLAHIEGLTTYVNIEEDS